MNRTKQIDTCVSVKDIDINKYYYTKILSYFDELNKDSSHMMSNDDICTPMECVKK